METFLLSQSTLLLLLPQDELPEPLTLSQFILGVTKLWKHAHWFIERCHAQSCHIIGCCLIRL